MQKYSTLFSTFCFLHFSKVTVEYKQGRPQISEMGALFAGLVDRLPKGPKANETGSSPARQRHILRQAARKIERDRQSGYMNDIQEPKTATPPE